MNLTKIRYFVEVARCGSFSEAARRLYTAQPNISKQIAQMEQELDFPLFIRDKRSVHLTAAGQLLYEHLKDLPDDLEQLFKQAKVLSRRETSCLTVGILEGQEVRPQLLQRLGIVHEIYPQMELTMERNSFSNLRNGLKSRHYDLIVTLDFDVEQEKEFASLSMFPQVPAIAIHKKHPLADRERLDMIQLKDEDFVVISPEESPVGYERFVAQCEKNGFTPHVVREPRNLESLILCVEMGVGVALLDQHTRLAYSDQVRVIPVPGEAMSVVAAYMRDDFRPMLRNVVRTLAGERE